MPRAAVEALVLEGYRWKRFSEGQLRQMFRFSSRMRVHAFLKEHGVHLHYSLEDLGEHREISQELEEKFPRESLSGMIVVADTSPLNHLVPIGRSQSWSVA